MGSLARQTMRKAKWILFVYMGL
ncbi:MAG: hypothetical protein JWL69_1641, partial [Phycisphaerales bacterium]|nr:hypothetical protein [Phycisphaerales bacterium]